MTAAEIDQYLAGLDEPKRSTLAEMRRRILQVLPEAEQCLSYSMPGFKIEGQTVAGLAAFKHHLSYLPHSGSVLSELAEQTQGYAQTAGSLHFAVDTPLPLALIEQLLAVRLRQAGLPISPR